MSRDAEAYGYNFAGLFALLAGIDWHRSHAFFCSQFVAWLFAEAGVPLTGKPPALTRPYDLARSDKLEPVFAGDLRVYLQGERAGQAASAGRVSEAGPIPRPRPDGPAGLTRTA